MSGRGLIIFDGFCSTQVTLSPAAIVLNTTAEQTFTCNGLLATDIVLSVEQANGWLRLGIVGWRVKRS